jgi:hypothetical protein
MSPLIFRRRYEEIVNHTLMLETYAPGMKMHPAFLWNKLEFSKHGNVDMGF